MEMKSFFRRLQLVLLVVLTTILMFSCEEDLEVNQREIVVEGWIADGGFPIVMVTSTLPLTKEEQSLDSLNLYIAQWARVSITTGGKTVYLTGMYDRRYFPPYIFTTTALRGKVGESYHLTVDWQGMHAEATTTIPPTIPLDDIWSEPCDESDTLRQIVTTFHDDPSSHDYYLFFARRNNEPLNPQLCMFGVLDDAVLVVPDVTQHIRRGGLIDEGKYYTPYFSIGDKAEVRLLHVDSEAYTFWHGFSDNQLLGNSFLFNVTTPLEGNVQGGHGVWYGCGMDCRTIVVQ